LRRARVRSLALAWRAASAPALSQALVGNDAVLSPEKLASVLSQYNTQNFTFAPTPSGALAMTAPFGQVDETHYVEPGTGQVLVFDHTKGEWKGETEQKQVLAPEVEAYRKAIQSAARPYLAANYKEDKAALAVFGKDDGKIDVCISGRNSKLSSFWTGGLRSRFSLDVSTRGQVELTALIKINVHYYEDGNVQLHAERTEKARVEVKDPETTAKSVMAAIEKIEADYYNNLEELYVSMHNVTFKALRRFLPISGRTFNWDNVGVHSLAQEVSK
jgi:capping protein alpha